MHIIKDTQGFVQRWRPVPQGAPTMIVVHRTGNPNATARSNNRWAYRTGAASWHYIIDDNGT